MRPYFSATAHCSSSRKPPESESRILFCIPLSNKIIRSLTQAKKEPNLFLEVLVLGLPPKIAFSGSYRTVNALSINILTFLKSFVNRTVIDHLILDNEGPEYDIVPMIAIDNVFEDNGILICSMNVEVSLCKFSSAIN